ncbi:RNA polymerase sigma-70 factor [Nocardiopsis coralliicola]
MGSAEEGRAEEFEELRPLLFAIAYRMLGSVSEAEDAVQETWLRFAAAEVRPESVRAWLSTTVSRIAVDVLRSARKRREAYVGPWFPEPLLTDPYDDPARSAELADSVSMAALMVLERLSPLERAAFLLREVFGFGYGDIAAAVGRSEAACRQLCARARRHMADGRPRFDTDRAAQRELADRFFGAIRDGDVGGLQSLLAADAQLVGDGGGKSPQLARTVAGAAKIARLLAGALPSVLEVGATIEPCDVNGGAGAVLQDAQGQVVTVIALEVLDGQIQAVRAVSNPDKLAHLGGVGDIWAVHYAARDARSER